MAAISKFGGAGGKFGIRAVNLPSVLRGIDFYGANTINRISRAAKIIAVMLERKAKKLVKTGYYQPAWKTGMLFRTITGRSAFISATQVVIELGVFVDYAFYVHEGTYKMRERPFLVDAVIKSEEEIDMIIKQAFGTGF